MRCATNNRGARRSFVYGSFSLFKDEKVNSIQATGGGSEQFSQLRQTNPKQRFEKELDSFLQSQGLSAEQQTQVKQDLKQAVQANFQSGFQPGQIKNTVQGVLDQHGLDGKSFTSKLPSPGASQSPFQINSAGEATFQQLLELFDNSSTAQEGSSPKPTQPTTQGNEVRAGRIDVEA